METRGPLTAVGRCVKAFGVRGEIVIFPLTGSIERFRRLRRVFVGATEHDAVEEVVTGATVDHRGVRLTLAGATDRTSAEGMTGKFLFVEQRDRVRLRAGTYFVDDIIGMTVIDETRTVVGTVKEVLKLPAHDVYVIDTGRAEAMIPAVKKFIRHIDPASRTVQVRLIEGMVEGG